MNIAAKGVLCLLPLLLGGCIKPLYKSASTPASSTAPPLEASAPPKPETSRIELSAEDNSLDESSSADGGSSSGGKQTRPPVRRPKPPAHPPVQAQQQTASSGAAEVSAIGQLSSGEPADARAKTVESIAATERKLKSLHRPLSEQEQKIAAHIREYLKQARKALNSGDVDGANTLAAKASVLLKELAP
jgi:hypothetical protein